MSEVSPLPSSVTTATRPRTITTPQMPSVRQGCVALARAKRSVNERPIAPSRPAPSRPAPSRPAPSLSAFVTALTPFVLRGTPL